MLLFEAAFGGPPELGEDDGAVTASRARVALPLADSLARSLAHALSWWVAQVVWDGLRFGGGEAAAPALRRLEGLLRAVRHGGVPWPVVATLDRSWHTRPLRQVLAANAAERPPAAAVLQDPYFTAGKAPVPLMLAARQLLENRRIVRRLPRAWTRVTQ